MKNWPRLLAHQPLVPGVIKSDYEDFQVEEIPLYPFSGEGTHTFFKVEKRGLSSMQAVSDISRALGVRRMDIGIAGLKDAKAVTRQWMSVEHIEPDRLKALDIPRLKIVETTQHTNKLRIGHLRGNRFLIKVRSVPPASIPLVRAGVAQLAREGVPNYFGQQRFGSRGDTWMLGREMLRNNLDEALDLMLGRPNEFDSEDTRAARSLYEQGNYDAAAKKWPGLFKEERRALRVLEKSGKKKRAFLAIDERIREFYLSAYQSDLFNRIVAERLPMGLGKLEKGDLAYVHGPGAVFFVEDPAREQPRADALEISPTGPMFGNRMSIAEGIAGTQERTVLEEERLTLDTFRTAKMRIQGNRRPLRFPVRDVEIELEEDGRGAYLALRFTLPRGCYATALLRELFDASLAGDTDSDDDE